MKHERHLEKRVRLHLGKLLLPFAFLLFLFGLNSSKAQVTHIVISQVYGGGGNSGAPYLNDFVELFNPTAGPIDISGWAVQYASSTGTSWTVNSISSGIIPSGGYFLVQLGGGTTSGVPLPTPDATGTSNMSGSSGKVALTNDAVSLSGGTGCPTFPANVVDYVGFGSANCFETAAAPGGSNTTSISRASDGCTDTDNNSSDFSAGAPNPRNSSTPTHSCATTSTAILGNISQPAGSIVQGAIDEVLAGFTLESSASADFTDVTVTGSGTATGTDLSSVRIFRDNDGNGAINGADASVSGAGIGYSASMAFTISGETGITTTRNYLIVADVSVAATPGNTVTVDITPGNFTTTASANVGQMTGASRTIISPSTPTITVTGTLSAFSTIENIPSASQTYTVEGVNLTTNIQVAPPTPFEVSTDGLLWTPNPGAVSLVPTTGTVSPTTIYVRYNPTAAGSNSGNIDHTSLGAVTQQQPVSGTAIPSPGPLLYGTTASTYFQDFNGLPTASTNQLITSAGIGAGPFYVGLAPVGAIDATGWQFGKIAGSGADAAFRIDNGATGSGAAYSYGIQSTTERAFGALASGSITANLGVVIQNTTSDVLNSITITYVGEQWRSGGGASPTLNKLQFSYSLDGTDILSGTYTPVPDLDFTSPVLSTTSGPLDGDSDPNRTLITHTFNLAGNWLPGQLLILRWDDFNDAGNDQGLAIDSFSFVANVPQEPLTQDNSIVFSGLSTTTFTADWTNGDGASHLVLINTVNSFTDPVDGNSYPANSVYGGSGEQVVYDGSGSSVSVSGLTPNTTYFVRVYGYNGTGASSNYLTTTATDNPNSVTTDPIVPPTNLVILSINNGNPVVVNQPFTMEVETQDAMGNPQPVLATTNFDITVFSGIGSLTGTIAGSIPMGSSSVQVTGLVYDFADVAVQLDATVSSGDPLASGQSPLFDVLDVATALDFQPVPPYGITATIVDPILVNAIRSDLTLDIAYTGAVTLDATGPGIISGTLVKNAVSGVATFDDIQFSAPGAYTLTATASGLASATSATTIYITDPATMTELVIPQYIGAKTGTSSNTARTPIAMCVQLDNLVPNTSYDLRFGVDSSDAAVTSYGAGNYWTGAAYSGNIIGNAFTTDGSGSSGPYWIYMQPASSRFEPGQTHTLRLGYAVAGSGLPTQPSFVGAKLITALDISTTERTTITTDDGAFLLGHAQDCFSGKFILIYDNEAGTGDPLYSYPARQAIPTAGNVADLPTAIADVYTQSGTSTVGDYVGVIPIGANNPNGVRRIEARNDDNTTYYAATDADGIWPSGADFTTIARRGVGTVPAADALETITMASVTSTPATCFGGSDGTATASALSSAGPVNYLWSPGGQTSNMATGLSADTYSVTATNTIGCTATGSTTVGEGAEIVITGVVTNSECTSSTGAVDISVSGGAGSFTYSWSNGPMTQDISGVPGGSYTVTVTDASLCTATATFNVGSVNSSSPLIVLANPTHVCTGQPSVLTASGAATYSWSPATDLSATSGATVTSTPSSSITYTVTGDDGLGCISSATVSVTVVTDATITEGGPTTFCDGGSVMLTANDGGVGYLWSPGGETTQSISATTTGSYSVTVDYGNGCVFTSSATNVTVNTFEYTSVLFSENMGVPTSTTLINNYSGWQNNTPPIDFVSETPLQPDVRTSSPSSGYTGFSGGGNVFYSTSSSTTERNFVISGINTLGYSNLTLTFGLRRDAVDSTNKFEVSVSDDGITYSPLSFPQPASNNSWGLVTASGTIPSTANLRIKFGKLNSSSFRLDDVTLTGTATSIEVAVDPALNSCSNEGVLLTSNIPTGNTWSYDGSMGQSLFINAVGPYSTTVMATGTNGCVGTSALISGTINPSPSVSITATTNATCFGDLDGSATASGSGGTGALDYLWSNAETTASISGIGAGAYVVTVTDAVGCTASATATITEPSQISLTAEASDTIICDGEQITLSSFGSTFKLLIATNDVPVAIPDNDVNGAMSSILIANVSNNSLYSGQITNVKINSLTHPLDNDLTIRLVAPTGQYLTLVNQQGAGANFTNTQFTPSATNLISAGTPPFTGTFVPDTGVTATEAFDSFIGIDPNGTWSLWVIDNVSGNTGTIDSWSISFQSPTVWSWTSSPVGFTSSDQSPGLISPSTLGLGVVTYTVTATNTVTGCTATSSVNIHVNPIPGSPAVDLTQPTCAVATGTITVTAPLGAGYSYSIDNVDYSNTTGIFTGVASGNYNVTVMSAEGCISAPTLVTIDAQPVLAITSFNPTSGCVGSTVTISGSAFTTATSVTFSGISATFVVNNDGEIDATVPAGATTGAISIMTSEGCSTTSSTDFTVVSCGGVIVNLKLFLQGYYLGAGMMNPVLANQFVPGATGLETDTIYVELRDAGTPSTIVDATTAVLMTNGTATAAFSTASPGSYWIAVRHRNTVQTWSGAPVSVPAVYDFTTSAGQAFFGNMIDQFGEGIYSFYTGDLNQDEFIDIFDFPQYDIDNQSFVAFVYAATDFNGDGFVDIFDFPVYDNNNQNFIFSLHP